jgi:hypothetical protein
MEEFLAVSLSYPTVIFTGLLAAAFLYWILVIVGALGIDILDVHTGHHGVAEGAAEGAHEGAAEGIGHHGHPGHHGDHDIGSEHEGGGMVGNLFAFRLRAVPLTLVLSLVILVGWILCWLGARYLLHGMTLGPEWLIGTALLATSIIVAFPVTAVLVRPLAHVLKVEKPVSRRDLVGKVVRVDTSRVDHRFGMAKAEDGAGGLLVQVRCEAGDNGLHRGSNALIVRYDATREVYEVAPLDDPPDRPPAKPLEEPVDAG